MVTPQPMGASQAPVGGVYRFSWQHLITNGAAGEFRIGIYKNGVMCMTTIKNVVSTTGYETIMVGAVVDLVIGDYVTCIYISGPTTLYLRSELQPVLRGVDLMSTQFNFPANPNPGDIFILPGGGSAQWDGTEWTSLSDSSVVYPLPITQGGTGASTAAGARTNLGINTATGEFIIVDGTVRNRASHSRAS